VFIVHFGKLMKYLQPHCVNVEAIIARGQELVGSAKAQVKIFADQVNGWSARFPEAKAYVPGSIL